MHGNTATFQANENVAAGFFALTGVSLSFKITEAVAAAPAYTGVAASFMVNESEKLWARARSCSTAIRSISPVTEIYSL